MTLEQEIKIQASYAYDDGFSDGVNKGMEQGSHDKAVETARILIANNVDFHLVSKSTGLPLEEVERIAISKSDDDLINP